MGLILGPLFIFWFLMAAYSVKIGYSLLAGSPLLSYKIIVVGLAIVLLGIYVYLGLASFKAKQELWVFAIPFFFMAHKVSFAVFSAALLIQWFGQNLLTNPYLKAVPFLIIFTIAAGALVGSFCSDDFMKKYNITITY